MSTRVSTAGMHNAAIAELLTRQAQLSRTQTQVASGKRVQSPADDPIAATRIVELERGRTQLAQYATNAVSLQNRLGITEQAMADTSSLLQRVRDLALQANSGAVDPVSRGSIAAEIRSRIDELQSIANRRDASGEYLFAGFSSGAQPFSRAGSGVDYAGDQGERFLQISSDQRVADGVSGHRMFMSIPQDNGTFTTGQGVHAGTGSIDNGRVVDRAAWVPGTYTVAFATPDTWEVRDATNTVVSSGAYSSGNTISFNGAQVVVSGAPAAGDTFTVAPAGRESIFDTLDQLVATLGAGAEDSVTRSTMNTGVNAAIGQIDQALTHVFNLRSEVGARLNAVDSAEQSREALDFEMQGSLSELQDLDYAEAVSRMNQQLTGLQAAQAAYSRIAQLSLFDYL